MGEDTAALVPRALTAFGEAGRQAAAMSAHRAAARHYEAALGLTAPDDAPGRATLVLAQANALRNAGALELGILQRALEAQVLVERFEAAARIEWMLADWYERHQASGEDQDRALLRGAEFAARGAPSEVMCLIGGARARRLINAGHSEAALALVDG